MNKPKIPTSAEVNPYSWKLRILLDTQLTDTKFTQTEILNRFMTLASKRERDNKFTSVITKDVYFAVIYDLISNTLFEKDNIDNAKHCDGN